MGVLHDVWRAEEKLKELVLSSYCVDLGTDPPFSLAVSAVISSSLFILLYGPFVA